MTDEPEDMWVGGDLGTNIPVEPSHVCKMFPITLVKQLPDGRTEVHNSPTICGSPDVVWSMRQDNGEIVSACKAHEDFYP